MDISPYFIELLAQKDQVIIPGLGRFFKKRTAGYYDEESKSYYPPSGELDFSSEYLHDDKLVHLISQRNNTSLTSAYAILDEFIRDTKNALKTEDIFLKGIGKLSSNDGKLKLESQKSQDLNPSFFGLPIIDTNSVQLIGDDSETYSLAQQALNTSMPDDVEETEKRSIFSIIMMIIAVIIIAGAVGLYFAKPEIYTNIVNQIQTRNVKIVPDKPSQTPINPNQEALQKADSIYSSQNTDDDIEAKLKAQGFDVEKSKDSTDVSIASKEMPKKGGFRYEIIIGLYLQNNEAEERVKQLKSYGINAYILKDKDGPMIKISGATLYSDAEAEKELKRIRKEINPEAFKKAYKILN